MPEITNPQVVDFCNNTIRPMADLLARVDALLPGMIATYNARDLGTVINNAGAGNLIADGSEKDGRTRRTGGDVYQFINVLTKMKAAFLDDDNIRETIVGWQVNGLKIGEK